MRPFRFGAGIGGPLTRDGFIDAVRQVESLGYSTLVMPDHLIDQFAPISALGLAAAVTTRLRLGTFVLNNDLRHPAVLAQELATLDRLSGGRLEIGIGAGWNRSEYSSAGITFDRSGTRIARLTESVTALKALFREGPVDFEGRFYRISGFADLPRPMQRPHPPILIGGGGQTTLTLAAREADIVGLAPRAVGDGLPDARSYTFAAAAEKLAWVKAAAGERFSSLEINTYSGLGPVSITDSPRTVARAISDRLKRRVQVELSEDEVLESPHVFVGSVEALVEKCHRLREELGISYIVVTGDEATTFAPVVDRLAGT